LNADIPVTVSAIEPISGPITGGTFVTITGQKFFNTGEITVAFGTAASGIVSAAFISSTTLLVTSPASSSAGVVSVEVALNGQQYTTNHKAFAYFNIGSGVVLTSTTPDSGPVTGQTHMSIAGVNFVNTSEIVVRFRAEQNTSQVVYAPATFITVAQISCVAPSFQQFAGSATVIIDVSLNGQEYNSTTLLFSYYGMY